MWQRTIRSSQNLTRERDIYETAKKRKQMRCDNERKSLVLFTRVKSHSTQKSAEEIKAFFCQTLHKVDSNSRQFRILQVEYAPFYSTHLTVSTWNITLLACVTLFWLTQLRDDKLYMWGSYCRTVSAFVSISNHPNVRLCLNFDIESSLVPVDSIISSSKTLIWFSSSKTISVFCTSHANNDDMTLK